MQMLNGKKYLEITLLDSNQGTIKTVEALFGRTLYSFKTHAKQADIYNSWQDFIKTIEILTIGAAGCGILFISDDQSMKITSATLSFIAICCSIHLQSKDYEKLISSHLEISHRLWFLKEQLSALCSDFENKLINEQVLREGRDKSLVILSEIYKNSLPTSVRAYKKAQKALKHDEEHSFSDQELELLRES